MPRKQAAIAGRARDRLRDRRDDADAGVGVRAARVRHRAHRAAVHRVRADAGRRGAGVGLRRADAVADDVLAAAAGTRSSHSWIYNTIEGWLEALTSGYRRAARPRRCTRAGWSSLVWVVVAGLRRAVLHAAQVGARADRGPRRRLRPRHGAAGLDAAVHGRPAQADRGVLRAGSRGRRVHGDLGLPDRRRRQRGAAAEAVGGAHARSSSRSPTSCGRSSRRSPARSPSRSIRRRSASRSARRRSSTS